MSYQKSPFEICNFNYPYKAPRETYAQSNRQIKKGADGDYCQVTFFTPIRFVSFNEYLASTKRIYDKHVANWSAINNGLGI